MQGNPPESNLAGKDGHGGEYYWEGLERGVGRGQITKGHDYQSGVCTVFRKQWGTIEGFERRSDMIRAVL